MTAKETCLQVLITDNITNVNCNLSEFDAELDRIIEMENKIFFAKRWSKEISNTRQRLQLNLSENVVEEFIEWCLNYSNRLIKIERYGATLYLYRAKRGEICMLDYMVKQNYR